MLTLEWLGRRITVEWLSRYTDLTLFDLHTWGLLKDSVFVETSKFRMFNRVNSGDSFNLYSYHSNTRNEQINDETLPKVFRQ